MYVVRNMSGNMVRAEERALCGDGGGILWRDWAKQSEQRSRGE